MFSRTCEKCWAVSSQGVFYGWIIVLVCVMIKLAKCQGQNNIMTYTVPHLLEDLELSEGELGVMFSFATVSASLIQPLIGRCVDKLGARACVPAAHAALCVTLILFSLARAMTKKHRVYFEVVFLFFLIRGLSLGALEVFPNACVQKWFVRYRGRAVSVLATLQQFGLAAMAPVSSILVTTGGWRHAADMHAATNLFMIPITLLLIRRTPEACGLLPDGDPVVEAQSSKDETERLPEAREDGEPPIELHLKELEGEATSPTTPKKVVEEPQDDLPSGLWPLYLYSFCFSLIFGGADFYMMGIVEEAGGAVGGVDVANHIFLPISAVQGIISPFLGELVDRCKDGRTIASAMLCVCALSTFASTLVLTYTVSPAIGILYAVLRAFSGCVFFTLINSGTMYMLFGVQRHQIGRALGNGTSATIAGTGIGPLLYGVCKDVLGNFWCAVWLSAVPHLLFGVLFAAQALATVCSRAALTGSYSSVQSKSVTTPVSGCVVGSPAASYEGFEDASDLRDAA
eukprot:TRINITY_DN50928_c0_g1_i1.p1 TRINITY_DN50928_c0_g1~~TRINITY_DN50928_c0_g1_i1.p1  ORF type:complete len:514 (-),score=32.52 TRINITY_DN50928_c0_g1_i1:104-1645(-)